MIEADDLKSNQERVPIVAGFHQAETIESSFVEEIESISESLNIHLYRTGILKALSNALPNVTDYSTNRNERENGERYWVIMAPLFTVVRGHADKEYSIADLKALLPHTTVCPCDQNNDDCCTLMGAINYIQKLKMEYVEGKAITDRLDRTYTHCITLAHRLQHLKDTIRTQRDKSKAIQKKGHES